MTIKVYSDHEVLGREAGEHILSVIAQKPAPVIGLATGSSPVPVYQGWGALAKERGLSMGHVECFALDEYCGLPINHPESYHSVIDRDAVQVIGLDSSLVHVPQGNGDVDENAVAYEEAISRAGGVDLQILGLGRNGHLGFNEPGSAVTSRTRKIDLMPETISDNSRFFDHVSDVPTSAITQGIGTILDARELIIVVTGAIKAPAVAAALEGPVTEDLPASLIREHQRVTWYIDEAAASLLQQV